MKNQKGGFIKIIILLIVAFFIMRYYGVTITGAVTSAIYWLEQFPFMPKIIGWIESGYNWLKALVLSVW